MQVTINGTPREVPDRITVARLLEQLDVRAQHVAVEVNRELVPRASHTMRQLCAQDAIEIVTLVGGGCDACRTTL